MTGVQPHARGSAPGQAWRGFRRWRRSRPFWGGLFTLLGGVWIFGTTQLSLGGLTFQMGPTGFLSWLIPTILATCGLLIWFTPNQRMFYAIVAAVTAVYSLIGVNLGGFFVGMLLGLVGAALGFAWTPLAATAPAEEAAEADPAGPAEETTEAYGGATATMDDLMTGDRRGEPTGPMTDVLPPPHNPLAEPPPPVVPGTPHRPEIPDTGPGTGPQRGARLFGIVLLAAGLSAVGTVALPTADPAYAKPCPITRPESPPSAEDEPAPGKPPADKPDPTPTANPTPTATAAPGGDAGESEDPVGDFFGGVVDGVKDLLGIGEEGQQAPPAEPAPTATPTPAKPAEKPATKTPPTKKKTPPKPVVKNADDMDDLKECTKEDLQQPGPDVRAEAEPAQPRVARPSRLTGSLVTMFGLSYDGVAELPTAEGTIRALKFSMDRSVTNDFELLTPGPGGITISLKSSALTVEGNVSFYASRFHGTLLGIPLTFTPDHPPPLTLPIMIFGDPDIQLVFVDCENLSAPDLVTTIV